MDERDIIRRYLPERGMWIHDGAGEWMLYHVKCRTWVVTLSQHDSGCSGVLIPHFRVCLGGGVIFNVETVVLSLVYLWRWVLGVDRSDSKCSCTFVGPFVRRRQFHRCTSDK